MLGAGATFAALTNTVPGLLWFGEYKAIVFLCGGIFLGLGWAGYGSANKDLNCELNIGGETACETTHKWVRPLLVVASITYLIGIGFAYVLPYLM